jgi:hypothetical protein
VWTKTKMDEQTVTITREELEELVARKDAIEAEITALVEMLNSPVSTLLLNSKTRATLECTAA